MWCKLNSPVLHFQFTQKPSGDVTENLAERELERERERAGEGEKDGMKVGVNSPATLSLKNLG